MAVGQARLMRTDGQDDRRIYVEVLVNGHVLRAMVDTGAPTSVIFLRQAERAGIDMKSAQVLASIKMGGVGSERRQSWIARMGTFSIGGEEIRNSPIRVVDDSDDRLHVDMLLGVDFLMAHHVLVALGEHKMYLTYNGGPIFSVSTDRETGHIETRAENMGAAEKAPDPKTADEFAGRASGRLTRKDVVGAIADFGEAIRLAPDRADLLSDRAKAYARGKQFDLALKDLDAALTKAPTDHDFLARRARLRLIKGDKVAALADADAAAALLPKGSLDVIPVADLYERLGKADRALALLDPAIDLHRDGDTYIALVNARAWDRALANVDLDRALTDSNTTIHKVGPDPDLLDTRALVQFRRKAYPAAIADTSAALAKHPKQAESLFVRGLARHASGDDAGGKADILAARAIKASIDRKYALYGILAPKSDGDPVPSSKPDGDDDNQE